MGGRHDLIEHGHTHQPHLLHVCMFRMRGCISTGFTLVKLITICDVSHVISYTTLFSWGHREEGLGTIEATLAQPTSWLLLSSSIFCRQSHFHNCTSTYPNSNPLDAGLGLFFWSKLLAVGLFLKYPSINILAIWFQKPPKVKHP